MNSRTTLLAGAVALFLLLTGAGLVYLRTEHFQEFVRTTLVAGIERNTGLDGRMESFHLDVYTGRLRIDGLELAARDARAGLSLLRIRRIRARFSLSSLWHFRMRLAELHLAEPEVVLATGTGGGASWNPATFLKTLDLSLTLETDRFTVAGGRFTVNERSAPFNLSLRDLQCRIGHEARPPGYRIEVAYKQSRLFYERRDIVHDLEVTATLGMQGVRIEHLEFRHGESRLRGSGSVSDWDSPVLLLDMSGPLSAGDLALADASLYEGKGTIDARTTLRLDKDGLYLKGSFSAAGGAYRKMGYSGLSGDFEILRDVLYLRNVAGRVGTGAFAAGGEIQLRASNNRPNRLAIDAGRVPLFEVGNLLRLDEFGYRNVADSRTVLIWGGGRKMTVECDALLYGEEPGGGAGPRSTLLGGPVRFTYFEDGRVDLDSMDLRSARTRVQASGGDGALYQVRLHTRRLSEPFGLIADLSPPLERLMAGHPDLAAVEGDFLFEGGVRILSSSDIGYEGRVSVKNGRWRSLEVDLLDAAARLAGSRLEFRGLSARRGGEVVRGDLELGFADEQTLSEFGFRGELRGIDLSRLGDFGIQGPPLSGALDGSGDLRFDGAAWAGGGRLSVASGRFLGQAFDRLEARAALRARRLELSDVRAVRGGTDLAGEGYVDLGDLRLNFTARLGQMPLEELAGPGRAAFPLAGRANASGTVRGTLREPELDGTFELQGLRYGSWDLGRGLGSLQYRAGAATGRLEVHSEFGDFSARARIPVGGGGDGTMALDFQRLNIRKIVAGKVPPYLDIDGTELGGSIRGEGDFTDWASVRFAGEIDGALFGVNGHELYNHGTVDFSIARNRLLFENARIQGERTDLVLGGAVALDDGSIDLHLSGGLDLGILSGLKEGLLASGNAVVDIRAKGPKQDPEIIGRLTLANAELADPDIPVPVSNIYGDMLFSTNVVRLENVHGTAASGTFALSGAYEHRNTVMESINLEASLQDMRLPYPEDFNSIVDASLSLTGDRDLQILSGEVDIIRSEYVRDFNLLERFAEQGAAAGGLFAAGEELENLRLNLEFRSNNGLVVDNELARARGSLRLTLRGTPAYPSLTGRVEAGEGTIFFRGTRFEISHAYADFLDRNRIRPLVEIRAEADVKTYRLILDATGTLDNLSVNITSDPPLSTVDILSLLTTGMAEPEGQTSLRESQMAGMSAASVLSENLTGAIGRRVQRILGLESFRVDPFLAGTGNDPTARITVSERISRDIVVTFSRNLSTNEEQVVVIEYDIGRGVSVTGTRDENGRFGIDFRLRRRLQ